MREPDGLDAAVARARSRYAGARPRSAEAHRRARAVLPGGNTRSVLHFEPFPFRVARVEGADLVDLDGHRYVDLCGNFSAGLLGHRPAAVERAVVEALAGGWSVGAVSERETELAERLCARFPNLDQVRFTNSGTEANLMAIGTALHHTGRSGVGVFDRGYHGGVLSFGPDPAGPHHPLNVPHRFVVAPYADPGGLDGLFADEDLGCVVVEAVQGSGGCRPAGAGFLAELRRRCDRHGVVLILDEVMTSRLAPGGAQERFGIAADLVTFGKYLGGGLTFGAFGGRRAIMAGFDPGSGGTLTQAGTFNNNVVTLAAAIATLDHELTPERLAEVNERGDRLREGLAAAFAASGAPLSVDGVGSMLSLAAADDRVLELFFHAALEHGLYPARRGYLALSMEVDDAAIAALVDLAADWRVPTGS